MSCGDKVRAVIRQTAEAEMPDLARDFPLAYEGISAKGKSFVDWFAVNVSPSGSGIDFANEFSSQQISLLQSAILPGNAYSHQDLFDLLGTAWFGFSSFTYVGPLRNNAACCSHFHQHVIAWLNHLVVPQIFQKNNNRCFALSRSLQDTNQLKSSRLSGSSNPRQRPSKERRSRLMVLAS